jgi:hypothetical protein
MSIQDVLAECRRWAKEKGEKDKNTALEMSQSCAVMPAYLVNRRDVTCRFCWEDDGDGRTMLTYDRVPNALYLCRQCHTPFRVETCPSPDNYQDYYDDEEDEYDSDEYD